MAGLALAGILVLAAAVTLASVVRLALHDRQQEIEIMQLVGAPVSYIRGPFVAEGVLQGGIGAVLALMLLYVAYVVGRGRLPLEAGATVVFLPWTWVLGLLAGGMVVGCIGGLVAARSAR